MQTPLCLPRHRQRFCVAFPVDGTEPDSLKRSGTRIGSENDVTKGVPVDAMPPGHPPAIMTPRLRFLSFLVNQFNNFFAQLIVRIYRLDDLGIRLFG